MSPRRCGNRSLGSYSSLSILPPPHQGAVPMSNDLTPSETRFVQALCGAGPLGIAPLGLARVLGVTAATIGNLSTIVERKGFCTRERYGMRIFLRPTNVALELVA